MFALQTLEGRGYKQVDINMGCLVHDDFDVKEPDCYLTEVRL